MMKQSMMWLGLAVLAACAEEDPPTNYEFTRDTLRALCERQITCGNGREGQVNECVNVAYDEITKGGAVVTSDPLDCGHDGAEACLAGIRKASCEAIMKNQQTDPAFDPCHRCHPY